MNIFKHMGELTTESNIKTQTNLEFIRTLGIKIGELLEYGKTLKDFKKFDYKKDIVAMKILKECEVILSDRFKTNISLSPTKSGLLSTFMVLPPSYNTLTGDMGKSLENMIKYVNSAKEKHGDEIVHSNSFISDINKKIEDMKTLAAHLETSEVIVDLVNGEIHNLPSSYKMRIDLCISKCIEIGATPNEIIAGILHEIGHTVTAFIRVGDNVINTVILLETIKEEVSIKAGSPINALKIANKKMGGEDLKDETDVSKITVATISTYTGLSLEDNKNYMGTSTEKERFADAFASRFLLGKDLVTLLGKLDPIDRPPLPIDRITNTYIFSTAILYSFIAILIPPLTPLILVSTGIIILLIGEEFGTSKNILNKYFKNGKVYDTIVDRMTFIKRENIKQLRMLESTDTATLQTKNMLLNNIDTIDEMLKVTKVTKPILSKLVEKVAMDDATKRIYLTKDAVEKLMENDLHYITK